MDKQDVSVVLERFSILLELLEEDSFRSRAYANAARLLENQSDPLDILIETNRLFEIKGIGKSISAVILEIYERGTFAELESAEDKVPPGIFQLLKVEGLGPKKAKTLWKEIQVTSLESLETAIHEGRLNKLSGFGGKTIDKFLTSIEFLKRQSGRHLRHHALRASEKLYVLLQSIKGVNEVFLGGSVRRGCETVGDLDVLVVAELPDKESVLAAILQLSELTWQSTEAIPMKGMFESFEVDISVCSQQEAPLRKLVATGSKPHFLALREYAAELGFQLDGSQFRNSTGASVDLSSEADVYHTLGLVPVPPALRENSSTLCKPGTITFSDPVKLSEIRGILHVHTTYSDGHHTLREMAEAMIKAGYEYLGIADHSQSAAYARGLTPDRVRAQWEEIDKLNSEFAPFRILKGTETDILADGRMDFDDDLLAGFDFVIASIHSGFHMSEAQATDRLCTALANPNVDILGHMTGRLLLTRNGYAVNHEQVISCAAKYHKAIELNANPYRLDIDWRWLKRCEDAGVPVPITPDAHAISGLSDIVFGVDVAAKGPLTADNCMSTWNADRILDWCFKHSS